MNRVLSIFIATLVVGIGYLSLVKDVHAIPHYPTYCTGYEYSINNGPKQHVTNSFEIYEGDTIKIHQTTHIGLVNGFDRVRFKLDEAVVSIVYGTNQTSFSVNNVGTYRFLAEVKGYRYVYYGYAFDGNGEVLRGNGPGGQRYLFEDVERTCDVELVVKEKPTPPPSKLTVTNATTGGSFSGTGTETDPYLVPNRTNTRFLAELLGGESITAWLINGNRVNSVSTRLDYTLWRTGDWIFGPEVKSGDGSLRQEEVFIRSL